MCVGHVVPEAREGGPIALVQDGDKIVIDSERRVIDWNVDEAEKARRKKEWEASDKGKLIVRRGVLYKVSQIATVSFMGLTRFLPLSTHGMLQ